MCLGVPGKIVEISEKNGLKMAKVDFGGIFREACLDYVPEAQVGEYCVIHVGFAISILSEADAMEKPTAILAKQKVPASQSGLRVHVIDSKTS